MRAPERWRAHTGAPVLGGHGENTTVADLIDRTNLVDLWPALGGGELRHGRGRAFWRDGDGYNVRVSQRGFTDFAHGESGGVLRLIELAHGCSRADAVRWLAHWHGVSLDGRRPDLRALERRQRARAEAESLVAWRDRLVLWLRAIRSGAWDDCNALARWADGKQSFDDDPQWVALAQVPDRVRVAEALDAYADLLLNAGAAELRALRQRLEGGAPC